MTDTPFDSESKPIPLTEEIRESIRRAAGVLKSFGAREVYLFGSAATGCLFEDSDIDLAVSGLPPEVFFRAMGQAGRELNNRQLDLICLDNETPFTRYLTEEKELLRVD